MFALLFRPLRAVAAALPMLLSALLPALLLSGCLGSLPPAPPLPEVPKAPPPKLLSLNLIAAPGMNPGPGGEPAPLVVRVYSLAADGKLMGAPLAALLADDAAALGADLLGREELRLLPGSRQVLEKELPADTRMLGVLAAYRQTDGVRWRAAAPIVAGPVNRFDLELGARGLSLAPSPGNP